MYYFNLYETLKFKKQKHIQLIFKAKLVFKLIFIPKKKQPVQFLEQVACLNSKAID